MIRSNVSRILTIVAAASLMALQGCFFGGRGFKETGQDGELTGVVDRAGWTQTVPYGMTAVPSGTFHMGQADEDITSSKINMNKQVTIGGFYMDETEITNNEYRQFMHAYLGNPNDPAGGQGIADTSSVWTREAAMEQLYPDTMVWINDFAHHMGDPMTQYYYMHPAFDEYPVVGITWTAAQEFCKWRTDHMNTWRTDPEQGLAANPNYRLPSEAEWEYASRGGRDMAKYPWGGPYLRNGKGCALANFKPGRGNYYDDGFQYTSPVGAYFANDYGLYDMAGNVAEWCEDAFHPASFPIVWDLNPTYFDKNERRKVIRGGSWKDVAFYVETGTRNYEYQDTSRSFIGFRCVMTYLGRSSGYEF